jgi:16S rRNA (guanine527-N7)-methyltransferase
VNEEEARAWVRARNDVPRETLDRLALLAAKVTEAAVEQNLVSARDLGAMWSRHIVDSLQLLDHSREGSWGDLGSGAGFPGLVIAVARPDTPVTLIEQRAKRCRFLRTAIEEIAIANASVVQGRTQQVEGTFANISARAYAPLPRLFDEAHHLAASSTRWLLPKGRNAAMQLAEARTSWHGLFRLEPSVTDPESAIIVAEGVSKRTGA